MGKTVVPKAPTPANPTAQNVAQTNLPYTKNFLDYLRENGTIKQGFLSFEGSATNTLYVCPVGKTFYITLLSLACTSTAAISVPTVDVLIDSLPVATISSGKIDGACANQIINFSNPIKIEQNQALNVYNNRANCWIRVCYTGYEI